MYVLAVLSVAVLAGQSKSIAVLDLREIGLHSWFPAAATPLAGAAPLVEAIFKRQGITTIDPGSIPAQCESQCGAVINAINVSVHISSPHIAPAWTFPDFGFGLRPVRILPACAATP